jgi:DNA-binding beta-propeller fold protein YncE
MKTFSAAAATLALLLLSRAATAEEAVTREPSIVFDRAIGNEGDVKTGLGSRLARTVRGDNPPLFDRPYGVAWADDALLVTDPGRGAVIRIDLRKRRIEASDVEFGEPIGAAACFEGIAVSDSARGTVSMLDAGLKLKRVLASGLERPTGLACLGDSLAVAETAAHRIAIIQSDGSVRRFGARGSAEGEFNFPTMLAARDNRLYVCDSMNFRVQIVDVSGAPLGSFGQLGDRAGTMPRLKGIGVDSLGHVWVADGTLDELAVYDVSGTFLLRVGSPGGSGGAFAFPAGIAIRADGTLAVADSLNRRVQLFHLTNGALK